MLNYKRLVVSITAIFVALLCASSGFIGGIYFERSGGVPLWQSEDRWSIGIYTGSSPFKFDAPAGITNPVLTAKQITDIPTTFVADPFMVKENGTWYMFFEALHAKTYKGKVALATSPDGLHWAYKKIVVDEPFHLSYPQVFKWQNDYYMIPESYEAGAIRLYKAVRFPEEWSFIGVLLKGTHVDSSIFRYENKWWLFTANQQGSDTLRLFYADDLLGPWTEHPQSPIIQGNAHIARPGGRVLVRNGRIIRYTQDDDPNYGIQVRAFEILELTPTSYREKEAAQNPILKPSGKGWNADGMHHIDPHEIGDGEWMASVDGNHRETVFRLKY